LVSSCAFDDTVPPQAQVRCSDPSECPNGQVCRVGFCIEPQDIDVVSPDLAKPAAVTPAVGRAGTRFTVSLVATKPLSVAPRLTLRLSQPTPVDCSQGSDAQHFACEYLATGDENDKLGGPVDFDVRLLDNSGNETFKRFAGVLLLDFSPPVLATATVVPPIAGFGTTIEVFFTASEALLGPAIVTSSGGLDDGDGGTATSFSLSPESATLNYRFLHTVTANDPHGDVSFTVSMTDLVGNVSTGLIAGISQVDSSLPAVLNPVVSPNRVKAGATVVATFTLSKPLAAPPAVTLSGLAMVRDTTVTAPQFRYTHVAQTADGEGVKQVLLSGSDSAGNTLADTVGATTFDFTAPVLAGRSVSPNVARLGAMLEVFASASEPLQGPAVVTASAGLDVGDGGFPTVFPLAPEGASANYRLTHVVTDADPVQQVSFTISMTDVAGNAATNLPVGSSLIDGTVPQVLAGAVIPARAKSGTVVVATFQASEALMAPPVVTVGNIPMTRDVAVMPPQYRYTHTAQVADGAGLKTVSVSATDVSGNPIQDNIGAVTFDFTHPGLATATVSYLPAPSNLLPVVTKATAGTTISVAVIADEALSTSIPTLTASFAATTLNFCLVGVNCPSDTRPSSLTAFAATFEAVVPAGTADGTYVPTLTWTDWVGNSGTRSFVAPPILVKTFVPTLTVNQSQVTFWRSLWGNASPENLGTFTVPAGPYFALAPQNPLANVASLSATAFTFGPSAPVMVRVWADATKTALLGTMPPNANGTWPRLRLTNQDLPSVQVSGVDEAGNESANIKLQNAEWVATLNPPAVGVNPHRLETTTLAQELVNQNAPFSAVAGAGAEGANATAIIARAEHAWRARATSAAAPSLRSGHRMAYDSARGRVVMFGGSNTSNVYLQDTWEWDGSVWLNKTPAGAKPPGRSTFGMAYDSGRGRTVVHGGTGPFAMTYQDTWEWDGTTWAPAPPGTQPSSMFWVAMAYDASRARVVMTGTPSMTFETWEWDGTSWLKRTPAGAMPPRRTHHAMAYDAARRRVVMFGGIGPLGFCAGCYLQDVWEWDGAAWVDKTPAAKPPGRYACALAYDSARSRVVLHGGNDGAVSLQDVWEWDGAAWLNKTPVGLKPSGRADHSMAFDASRNQMVLWGGSAGAFASGVWEWNGTAWLNRAPTAAVPTARRGHAMAYDSARARVVMFGGFTNVLVQDVWEWDGAAWLDRTPALTKPSARDGHAMAYDTALSRVVMFGGNAGASKLQDVWEWDGATWVDKTPAGTKPLARSGHAMAYDTTRSRLVMCGGDTGAGRLQDVWEWDGVGAAWLDKTPAGTKPSARSAHAMAFDASRARTVLFGGNTGTARLQDTWDWDGSAWVDKTPAGTNPALRDGAMMAYDSARARVQMFGGDTGTARLQDAWEWDGTTWVNKTPAGTKPPVRAFGAMAYDIAAGRALLYGGSDAANRNDTWELDASLGRQPAITFVALTSALNGINPLDLTVRAHCGGNFTPFAIANVGATLYGWATGGASTPPGDWLPLASGGVGLNAAQPWLPNPNAALMSWSAGSTIEAQRYVRSKDSLMAFQCRPSGSSGVSTEDARVALDYIELRVRYAAP
jgi:hypothetical protein